ncbi:MAG: cytoplasmic chaperone TorD family protein [Dehalococcoidia bacterium]|nr:cytoplasmic chaperone TorD family protein [Dehalococcoidia bacterium]
MWVSGLLTSPVFQQLPEDMRASLISLDGLVPLPPGPPPPQLVEAAAVEFTKLFRGIRHLYSQPPPYESLYREQSAIVFSETSSDVIQEYRRFGFAPGDTLGNEPSDHIGFEIEFVHLLCKLEAGAWDSENMDDVRRFQSAQKEFLGNHLLEWVPKFCDEVIARDSFGLFSALARFTKSWLNLEREQLLAGAGE